MQRIVDANRRAFDHADPAPGGAAEHRVRQLEATLAASQAENAALHHRLVAFQASTSWRLTRPLRWLIEALHQQRPLEPLPPPPIEQATVRALPYADWIATREPGRLDALAPGPGHADAAPLRLGIVLMPSADGHALPESGRGLPECCTVLNFGPAVAGAKCINHAAPAGLPPAEAVRLALERLDVDLLCFLDAGERLTPRALPLVASTLAQQPGTDLLFADEDWLGPAGERERPFFKPGWSPELQRGRDLTGPFTFFRASLVRGADIAAGPAWRYDLANQVAAATRPERIRHLPAILCHRTVTLPDAALQTAAAAQLQRDGVAAQLAPLPGRPGCLRVTYALPDPAPLVSVIVPTRDRADLLGPCADGILHATDYPRLELLILDNGTVDADALALLERLSADSRVRVLRDPRPFNWAALNNAGAAQARGDVLVLLNNDIAVLRPDWLTALAAAALQPGVGAAGAKLLYPDGRVQHAGLTTDATGVPRHLFRYAPGDAPGVFDLLALPRDVWAVTGACLAVRRAVFEQAGGLNEALAVAYNDVDFCLRLTALGHRVVWTPFSVLEHRELATRPPDHAPERREQTAEERARLLRDWGALVAEDPYLNPNLGLLDEHPALVGEMRAAAPSGGGTL